MRVRIRDVAEAANVDPSTVSRILANPSGRPTQTRKRVMATVEALGYVPNLLARSLSADEAPIVPLLVPDVTNWFFAEIARGAEEAARRAGYSLVLCNTERDPERGRKYLQSLASFRVPFAIVAPDSEASGAAIREFAAHTLVVVIDRLVEGLDLPSATVDNVLGGRLATQHLVDLGHRSIVCVAGPADTSTARERTEGYLQVVTAAGLLHHVIQGGFTTKDGVRAASEYLRLAERPTAAVCANDLCALGFVHELERSGLRVPTDLSVVGYDDLAFAAYFRPGLTSIQQPARRLGALAMKLALDARAGISAPPRRLRPRLVVRESTASI